MVMGTSTFIETPSLCDCQPKLKSSSSAHKIEIIPCEDSNCFLKKFPGYHYVKSVRIRSYSGPYFPAFGLITERYSVRMWENVEQNNSEYGHFTQGMSLNEMRFTSKSWRKVLMGVCNVSLIISNKNP